MYFTSTVGTPALPGLASSAPQPGAAWKHDIGNWQSRKSYAFLQQQQQQRSSASLSGVDGAGDTNPTTGGAAGSGDFRPGGLFSGATRRHPAIVSFGPTIVLPANGPTAEQVSFQDVDVSELSTLGSDEATADHTRPFDSSSTSVMHVLAGDALRQQAEDTCAALWVTVYGVPPDRMLDVRAAFDVQCGPTVTHVWPAASPQCNWMHVRFLQAFDAAKAVAASPMTLTALSAAPRRDGAPLTVGVEWCRSADLIRSLDAAAIARTTDLMTSEPPTRPSASFLSSFSLGRRQASSSIPSSSSRVASLTLRPAQHGNLTIVDAAVGGCGSSWLSVTAWLDTVGSYLSRRLTPEQRLERLAALTNQQFRAACFSTSASLAQTVGSAPLLVTFSATSPLFVWATVVNAISLLVAAFVVVSRIFASSAGDDGN